eukprot:6999241-Pyramimonas_sp.AAC.1
MVCHSIVAVILDQPMVCSFMAACIRFTNISGKLLFWMPHLAWALISAFVMESMAGFSASDVV